MARIFRRTFTDWDGRQYRLDIELDEDSLDLIQTDVGIEISAEVFDPRTDERQTISATVSILEPETGGGLVIRIKIAERTIEIPLSMGHRLDIGDAFPADEPFPLLNDLAIPDFLPDALEEAIQAIPALDPLLGCVVKSGISATVGQIIRCNNNLGPRPRPAYTRIGEIFRCLRESLGAVVRRAVLRTFRCWVTLGLG